MSLIEDGLAMLNEVLEAEASETFTYVRGNDTFSFVAVLGRPLPVTVTPVGVPTPDPLKSERVFIVQASELAINDTPITPETTDKIRETISGVTYEYKVEKPLAGGQAWSYVDGYRGPQARISINTKFSGTV